ncbi:hypothetical protein DV515_00014570, partial [Chloebia gouldiae]
MGTEDRAHGILQNPEKERAPHKQPCCSPDSEHSPSSVTQFPFVELQPFESTPGFPQGASPAQFCIILHPTTFSHPVMLPAVFHVTSGSVLRSRGRDRGRMSAGDRSWQQQSGPEA